MRENYFWPLYGPRRSSAKSCGKVRFTAHRGLRAHTRFVGPQIASCIFYNTQTRTQRTGRDRVRLGRPRPRFQELGRALLTANRLEMKETSFWLPTSCARSNYVLSFLYGEFDVFFESPSKIQTRVRPEMPLLSPSPLVPLDLWATLACTRTRARPRLGMDDFQSPRSFSES